MARAAVVQSSLSLNARPGRFHTPPNTGSVRGLARPEDCLHTVGFVDLPALRENRADPSEPRGPPAADRLRFVPLLARRIGEDLAVDLFTDPVLVAPSDVLQELMATIDAPTAASLLGT